jgi:transcriptional regulator with XRE-family HTH domain
MPDDKRQRKRRARELPTGKLFDELLLADEPAKFASKHKITKRTLAEYLQQLLEEKGLSRPKVVAEAGLNPTYGYDIFTGKKHPSREKVLPLAFAMKCTLTETNRLLRAAGVNELYVKDRRDAIIIFCIDHGYSLMKTNEALFRYGENAINDA